MIEQLGYFHPLLPGGEEEKGAFGNRQTREGGDMAASTHTNVARSDVVGSLLRPTYLREARQGVREGRTSEAELHTAEDRAVIVLGFLTTKKGALEDAGAVEARIREATQYIPLERLAVSPQCGFASGEAGNPLTAAEQEAILRLLAQVAQRVWSRKHLWRAAGRHSFILREMVPCDQAMGTGG